MIAGRHVEVSVLLDDLHAPTEVERAMRRAKATIAEAISNGSRVATFLAEARRATVGERSSMPRLGLISSSLRSGSINTSPEGYRCRRLEGGDQADDQEIRQGEGRGGCLVVILFPTKKGRPKPPHL